jgi:hypothetical protein
MISQFVLIPNRINDNNIFPPALISSARIASLSEDLYFSNFAITISKFQIRED